MTTTNDSNNTAEREAYEVLADWVRIYERYGIGLDLDGVDIFFDGYAENDDGSANTHLRCYSVLLHRECFKPDFEIADRSSLLYIVYTEPENAAQFYVWLTEDGEVEVVSGLDNEEYAWADEVIATLDVFNPTDWIGEIDEFVQNMGMRWVKRMSTTH